LLQIIQYLFMEQPSLFQELLNWQGVNGLYILQELLHYFLFC